VIGALGAVAVLVASMLWGCSAQQTPSAAPSASPATATPAAPTATPAPAYVDTLRVGAPFGWLLGGTTNTPYSFIYRGLYQGGIPPSLSFQSVVYSGLYRYDATFGVVTDLAAGPCVPQAEPKVIRCRLIATTFQDGTPLTADDVAYSYRLFQRIPVYTIPTGSLTDVMIVDPGTVDFALSSVDPTFLTIVLPTIPILPQHAVEAAYADFVARATGLTAAGLTELAATIDEETGRDPPVCTPRLDQVDALLAKLGTHLYREDFPGANGLFDPCWYMAHAGAEISTIAAALDDTGLQAVAQAFMFFAAFRPPVGTGPYRLVSSSADRVHLEAWPGYHGGPAATEYLDFVTAKADGSDLESGALDIFQDGPLPPTSSRVRVATVPTVMFSTLFINVRAGRLFADLALRRALQLCIDLPRDVDASTDGSNMPIYSPVLPGSWADDPAIPKTARDTDAAKRVIEAAGWQLGADGIYVKGEVRLAAEILARADVNYRTKVADLIAYQARDCGMDLRSRPTDFDDIITMLAHYPHDIPGTTTPFDLYVGGWSSAPDPAYPLSLFDSSNASNAEHPDYPNVGGFSDPALDRLLAAGFASYDQAERTEIYRQAQEELAAQVPTIFLWDYLSRDDVRSAVATATGPLDLTAPNWAWQPERMVVEAPAP
jgi:ABC-type transport system substrate-binding protein